MSHIDVSRYPLTPEAEVALREFLDVTLRTPPHQVDLRSWHDAGPLDPPTADTVMCACNWYAASPEGKTRHLSTSSTMGPVHTDGYGYRTHASDGLHKATGLHRDVWSLLVSPLAIAIGDAYSEPHRGIKYPPEDGHPVMVARVEALLAAYGLPVAGHRRVLSSR